MPASASFSQRRGHRLCSTLSATCRSPPRRQDPQPIAYRSMRVCPEDFFSTPRLLAERLTIQHRDDLRQMDQNEMFMAYLGGIRDDAATDRYLSTNLAHWAEHGFGLWMLRERETGAIIGRAVLRHLMVGGVDEVETGYGFLPAYWGRGLATEII